MADIFSIYNLELSMFFSLQVGIKFKALYVETFYIGMYAFSNQMGKRVAYYYNNS